MSYVPFDGLDVSRETFERLSAFHDLVQKWSPKINLVSKSDLADLWIRHIWDSAQVDLIEFQAKNWIDIGSGGGFPAVVLAILAKDRDPQRQITMIESDQRKAAFLRTAIRELSLNARVLVQRVESAEPQCADVVSARALAELSQLLAFSERHLKADGTAVFMKGAQWEKEVEKASESWSFSLKSHKSKTNPSAAILEIKDIKRA